MRLRLNGINERLTRVAGLLQRRLTLLYVRFRIERPAGAAIWTLFVLTDDELSAYLRMLIGQI